MGRSHGAGQEAAPAAVITSAASLLASERQEEESRLVARGYLWNISLESHLCGSVLRRLCFGDVLMNSDSDQLEKR